MCIRGTLLTSALQIKQCKLCPLFFHLRKSRTIVVLSIENKFSANLVPFKGPRKYVLSGTDTDK